MARIVAQRRRCRPGRGKVVFPTLGAAELQAERLSKREQRTGQRRPGQVVVVYYCPLHASFHIGHQAETELHQ